MQRLLLAATLAALAWTGPAQATNIALVADGSWNEFSVDNQVGPGFGTGWIDFANGSPLSFDFTIAAGSLATLTVVDAGFAGDTYAVSNAGALLGLTSSVPVGTTAGAVVFDFDEALANSSFSRGVFQLSAGNYRVTGAMRQSVLDAGVALDSSNGAVRLAVTPPVPEPSSTALLLAGLAAMLFWPRRRAG